MSPCALLPWTSRDRIDEPLGPTDLTTWIWQRATSAATAVLVAGAVGMLLGPFAAYLAAVGACAAAYVLGPLAAAAERYRWRADPPTLRQLRRLWGAVACLGAASLAVGFGWGNPALSAAAFVVAAPIATVTTLASVDAGIHLPRRLARPTAVAVPVGVAVYVGVETGASIVDGALALALLVVVPAALALREEVAATAERRTLAALGFLACGGLASTSLALGTGPAAAALTVPWVVVTAGTAAAGAVRWFRRRGTSRAAPLRAVVEPLASGYLAFGALWSFADRAGFEPAGFGPPYVQLTAVHFTYAGFIATLLAARAWRQLPGNRGAAVATATIAAAPPLIAVGFAAIGALQIVGAVVLTAGTWTLAWVTLRHVVPTVGSLAAGLLAVSSISVLAPMLLAVQWAVGANLGTPALSVPQMAATHGIANALGFALVGVLGWRTVDASPSAPR